MSISAISASEQVSLEEMLAAREHRVDRQRGLLARFPGPLICFSLNIAGPYKAFPLARKAFEEGCGMILSELNRRRISVDVSETEHLKTGDCAYFAVPYDPLAVKRMLCDIEESCALGRLFDMDLIGPDGIKISRKELGLPERACLICGNPSSGCARSRRHPVEELQRRSVELIQDYFFTKYADELSSAAVKALLYEVSVTPKPGLVDRAGNGAHDDMDFFTFLDSVSALAPQFRSFVLLGCRNHALSPEALFRKAQYQGRLAEDAMFAATNGVNTHKGLIFSLGLLCAAAGWLYAEELEKQKTACDGQDTRRQILERCAKLAAFSLPDLEASRRRNPQTHGEQVFRDYGVHGVRQQAAAGFPDAVKLALPLLEHDRPDYTGCLALLHLISTVQDTNVIHRRGKDGLDAVKNRAKELLSRINPDNYLRELEKMDRDFKELWVSPGGSADLLAISFFLCFLPD